jgi:NhaA family Na+:H+ antiporter
LQFYTETIAFINLFIAHYGRLIHSQQTKCTQPFPYLIGGCHVVFHAKFGVHATITGVLLAFVIPFGNGARKHPRIDCSIFTQVLFFSSPIAIANTCIPIN